MAFISLLLIELSRWYLIKNSSMPRFTRDVMSSKMNLSWEKNNQRGFFFDRQAGMSGGERGGGGDGGGLSAPAGRWAFQRCQPPLRLHHTESSAAPE